MFQSLLPRRKKPEDEAADNSLLAKAFSARTKQIKPAIPNRVPVAVYRDPYARLRRMAFRLLFTLVLPIVGLLIILLVTANVVTTNIKETPIAVESLTMGNVPLPAGVKTNGLPAISSSNYFKSMSETWLNYYYVRVIKVENYIGVNMTPNDLLKYYRTKLVESKQWQIQRQYGFFDSVDILFVRGLNNGQIEGIMLEVQADGPKNFNKLSNPDSGGTAFILAKIVAARAR